MPQPRTRFALLSLLSLVLAGCAETSSVGLAGPPVLAAGTATEESRRPHACIVQDGELRNVEVRIDPATDDTLAMDGRRFAEAYPATAANGYAAGAEWLRRELVVFPVNLPYHRSGLPRAITPEMGTGGRPVLVRHAEYQGVGLFADPNRLGPGARTRAEALGIPEIIYVPVGPGCLWQLYELAGNIRSVHDEP